MRILLAATLVALGAVETAWAQTTHVLALYSTRQEAPISVAGTQELPRLLQEGLRGELAFYTEYIDQGRFPDLGYQRVFSEFLRVKYKEEGLDLVIAIQDAALEFISAHRKAAGWWHFNQQLT